MLVLRRWLVCVVVIGSFAGVSRGGETRPSFATAVKPFLQRHCIGCHGADADEGGVTFHELAGVDADNAEVWKRIWEQVALKEMPPKDEEQPGLRDRVRIVHWITGELEHALETKGGFHAHLRPSKGNHLDHELLFGQLPEGLAPTSTPARLWRIHPQEHLVRLNDLINREPGYNPASPGLRTRGDAIPPNQEGEIKVYYGLDRVIGWVGGTAAYAAAITGFPPVLTTADDHGLRNYAMLYSVNAAEATQIARHSEDILRFMAFGPDAKPYQFADKVSDIDAKYKHESLRGLAESLFYAKEVKRPLTPVYDLMQEPEPTDEGMEAAVAFLFESLTFRPPTSSERATYVGILREAIDDLGKEEGVILGLSPIFLHREALFRPELAEAGEPDEHGRVLLRDWELARAVNAAFSYVGPDETLRKAAAEGRLRTREDAEREVTRILNDPGIRKPRVLQFFREYFDYDRGGHVCKDTKALQNAGGDPRQYYRHMFAMVAHTDRLVEEILAEDRDVLRELLTTNRVVVNPGTDARYFGEYLGLRSELKNLPKPEPDPKDKKKRKRPAGPAVVVNAKFPKGRGVHVRLAEVVRPHKTNRTLTTLPETQRMGILTHPSWLVSHSDAMDNHAILRGRWVRERLLGGAVPDVPITVDAMLPDEPKTTLRHRMRVTRADECRRCHEKMDPLGLPFEMFNHVGIYRKNELGKPVDTSGAIVDSGDPTLDGPVTDALDMIGRLADSERVEQVFVRHAFRYWMGRNETLEDAPVLQAAWEAYREHDGSMNAMLASLLTSDAFLYRKIEPESR